LGVKLGRRRRGHRFGGRVVLVHPAITAAEQRRR